MTTPKHSPLPLCVCEDNAKRTLIVATNKDGMMAAQAYGDTLEEAEANAEFIVRACNSHYELIRHLENAMVLLRTASY